MDIENEKSVCAQCALHTNKSFSHPSNLRRHQLVHTNKKPHICAVCDKSFSDPSSLRRHQLVPPLPVETSGGTAAA